MENIMEIYLQVLGRSFRVPFLPNQVVLEESKKKIFFMRSIKSAFWVRSVTEMQFCFDRKQPRVYHVYLTE